MAHTRCECCPFGNHDHAIYVVNKRQHIDIKLVEWLPVTTYVCGYMAFAGTVIMVDHYVSGKRKGLVKRITIADAQPCDTTNDWITSTDPKYWDMYSVEELTECTGRDCDKYQDKCPYCSGTRFYFKRLDNENKRVPGSYGRSVDAHIGLGYREEYRDYKSESYLSG